MKYGALNENLASRLFLEIVDGVTYCHRHYIVHYDLKLENILLVSDSTENEDKDDEEEEEAKADSDDEMLLVTRKTVEMTEKEHAKLDRLKVKIADFGLSQLCNPGQTSDYSAGSLAYIGPEVFEGGETAGPPRDVWALGVILFAMVCGRLPFMGNSTGEVVEKIKQSTYEFKESDRVSESCKQIIAGMLQPKPNERMTVSELRLMPWIDRGLPHTRAKTPIDRKRTPPKEEAVAVSSPNEEETDISCPPIRPITTQQNQGKHTLNHRRVCEISEEESQTHQKSPGGEILKTTDSPPSTPKLAVDTARRSETGTPNSTKSPRTPKVQTTLLSPRSPRSAQGTQGGFLPAITSPRSGLTSPKAGLTSPRGGSMPE